jgi:sporulation protein YlmC with PRC-barrel domain
LGPISREEVNPLKQFVIIFAFLFSGQLVNAQMSAERSALSNLRKEKWTRANGQLQKAMKKDSADIMAKYVYAIYFFTPKNPAYHVDSAHYYTLKTISNFRLAGTKQREKFKRFPLDSIVLLRLHNQIDSAAFEEAKNINTEKSYLHFLAHYQHSIHKSHATELRDEAAWVEALKQNTYQGFLNFIQKYPEAQQVSEAQKRYDKLLYAYKTKDKRLKSYEAFLAEYPNTPYRREIEKNIFEIFTASGSKEVFDQFVKKYSANAYVSRAKDILYHILIEGESHVPLPDYLETDSIRSIHQGDKGYLVPFLADGKFGFMDMAGKEIIKASVGEIDKQYLCGNITEDVITADHKVISKNGKVIFQGDVDELDDLGFGFLKINHDRHVLVLHKTGLEISERSANDAKLLNGKFIAFQKDERWSIWTLTGRKILDYDWDEVSNISDVIVLKKANKFKLLKYTDIAQLADQQKLKSQDLFDQIKALTNNFIWARTAEYEGILDQSLNSLVPFEKHLLTPTNYGTVSTTAYGKKVYNLKGNVSGVFENVKSNEQWTAVRQSGAWRLFNTENYHYQSTAFDSIGFTGPFAVGYEVDSLTVYLSEEHHYQFPKTRLEFIPGGDSVSYLLVEEGDKKSIYNTDGIKIFTVNYDKVGYAGNNIFIVSKKDKKGLITTDTKLILPVEYDAIGGVKDRTVSVLKNMRFGLFDISSRMLIKPQFDKNLNRYNDKLLTGFKNGFYGFIGWDGKSVSKFDFEEIIFWNDTAALVKKNLQWMLYEISTQKTLLDGIKDYKVVSKIDNETTAIVHRENNYGVFSSSKGIIIPINFTDVKNVGSLEDPMYFTEKHVEEASINIVIYYNKNGEQIRRQVYEEDEYEKIYCAE